MTVTLLVRRALWLLGLASLASICDGLLQVCGDGKLEALTGADNGICPGIGSQTANSGVTSLETCDVSSSARFGNFSAGCGVNSANCALVKNVPVSMVSAATDAAKSAQFLWGLSTDAMSNYDFNPFDASSSVPMLNPCLYSSQLVDANGQDTTDILAASACKITAADRVKYTTLQNCYASDPTQVSDFGARLDASDSNFALNGHKCQYPASIQVNSATGGPMTWTETPRDSNNNIVAPFDGLYDVCFTISDPSWPAVHPSSNEFLAQMTRIQYEVVCDPLDQEEAYPDGSGDCEVNEPANVTASYRADPGQHSHKCTRLGNRKTRAVRCTRLGSFTAVTTLPANHWKGSSPSTPTATLALPQRRESSTPLSTTAQIPRTDLAAPLRS